MYYTPVDFTKLTVDDLKDTGAITSAISEQKPQNVILLATEAKKDIF